ncbi:unnamed protein product [Amaranthus hypochondriacus]
MDDEKTMNEGEKLDEVMLPGFRFHPTDEELVGFYLKRKIQQRPLSIQLIKQLDIYKYDPWDLPKFGSSRGEKEWYFYCPRDRKYRNSARPNRVTEGGFWKATGTDRPIYSSEGSKCIGLKKSLVFYKGRAAKGLKTDWMMHEFRLPHSTLSKTSCLHKNVPANDSWAICRIFKKTSPITPRTMSHSWVSSTIPKPNPPHTQTQSSLSNPTLNPEYIIKPNDNNTSMQPNPNNFNELEKILQSPNYNMSFLDHIITSNNYNPNNTLSNNNNNNNNLLPNMENMLDFSTDRIHDISWNYNHQLKLPQLEEASDEQLKSNNIDISSMLLNMSSSVLENMDFGVLPYINGALPQDQMEHVSVEDNHQQHFGSNLLGDFSNRLYGEDDGHDQWDGIEAIGSIPMMMWDCAPPLL